MPGYSEKLIGSTSTAQSLASSAGAAAGSMGNAATASLLGLGGLFPSLPDMGSFLPELPVSEGLLQNTHDTGGRDYSAPSVDQARMNAANGAGAQGASGQSISNFAQGFAQEGMAGLFDMEGMLARQEAQRTLASQFNIVAQEDMVCDPNNPAPVVGGNTVTPEQFREICRTYSDIQLGRSDLKIDLPAGMLDADATAYREGTMTDIGRMLQTESGRELIGDLSNNTDAAGNHRVTTIAGNDPDPQNATANSGPNNSASVTYNPGSVWTPQPGASFGEPWMPMRSDVQLYHELTHAHHFTHGTNPAGAVTNADLNTAGVGAHDPIRSDVGGIAREEHHAVGIGEHEGARLSENAYRRERAEIAAAGGPGIVTGPGGDAGMAQRETYGEHGLGAPIP